MNKFIFTVVLMVSAIGGFAMAQGARGMGGGGISGQPIDGTVIKPKSVQASGTQDQFMCTATTAVCEVESNINAATMTATVPAFDIGPTATPGANDRLACFSYGASGSKTRVACVDGEGDITATSLLLSTTNAGARFHVLNESTIYNPSSFDEKYSLFGRNALSGASSGAVFMSYHTGDNEGVVGALSPAIAWRPLSFPASEWKFRPSGLAAIANITGTGAFNSVATSGNQAFTCTNVGCRLSLGSTARYFYDTGVDIGLTGANLYLGSATQLIYVAKIQEPNQNATLTLVGGKNTSAADSVGITLQTRTQSVAGAKIASFQNGTSEVSFIDYLGNMSANSYTAATTSGSSFTGGNSSNVMTLTSNTTDAVTTGNIPAIRLRALQDIADADLIFAVEDSLGNVRLQVQEAGRVTATGQLSVSGQLQTPGGVLLDNYVASSQRDITIADSGGAGAASYTLANSTGASEVLITCSDADGCDITLGETGVSLRNVRIYNVGTNTVNINDTSGVQEMAGNFAMGQYDNITFHYLTDRWVENGRSNN